mmetsp:Transcript_19717/g.51652  ORF Transcript_19717/g.51652 Transcript_19717/m.51652 type:complete len:221 (+) Transcript_19717:404-1066(+)
MKARPAFWTWRRSSPGNTNINGTTVNAPVKATIVVIDGMTSDKYAVIGRKMTGCRRAIHGDVNTSLSSPAWMLPPSDHVVLTGCSSSAASLTAGIDCGYTRSLKHSRPTKWLVAYDPTTEIATQMRATWNMMPEGNYRDGGGIGVTACACACAVCACACACAKDLNLQPAGCRLARRSVWTHRRRSQQHPRSCMSRNKCRAKRSSRSPTLCRDCGMRDER